MNNDTDDSNLGGTSIDAPVKDYTSDSSPQKAIPLMKAQ